jgi:hypothetical protein
MAEVKSCVCCGEVKSFSEYFRYQKNLDGFMTRCKVCHKISSEKSRQKHLKKSKITAKAYREKNKESIRQKNKNKYVTKPKRLQYQWPPPTEKKCTICGDIKVVSEFGKTNKTKHGIASRCKECIRIDSRERRKKPEFKIKASEYAKRYAIENSSRIKEYTTKYYIENKSIINERNKKWSSKNHEYKKQINKEYAQNNKDKVNIYTSRRRARIKNALHVEHNIEIEQVYQSLAIRVKNCMGIDFHVDHILPIDVGGFHHHGNLQVVPGRLNESKRNRLDFKNPLFIHWEDLPDFLLENIKLEGLQELSQG